MLWIHQQVGALACSATFYRKRVLPHSRVVLSTEAEFKWLSVAVEFIHNTRMNQYSLLVEKSKRDVQISALRRKLCSSLLGLTTALCSLLLHVR